MVVATGICILAGGLSTRMGQDKARVRLGRRTLLGHVRGVAQAVAADVRIIRNDLVPRCGPLGGIYTGLRTSTNGAELFLSCDMPFITAALLEKLLAMQPPVFIRHDRTVGFPFFLATTHLAIVEAQIKAGRFSLQNLAKRLHAKTLPLRGREARQLFNVNTPDDFAEARRRVAELPL